MNLSTLIEWQNDKKRSFLLQSVIFKCCILVFRHVSFHTVNQSPDNYRDWLESKRGSFQKPLQ